jgi:hypothetical protein
MRDLPRIIPLEQSEYIGSARIGSSQLARPVLYFQMNYRDTLDDLDAGEARIDIRCRTVFVDPLEDVFNGARILHSLTVTGDGCGRMKSRAHKIAVACTRPRDVAMHRARDRIMFDEVRVGGGLRRGEIVGSIDGEWIGARGS